MHIPLHLASIPSATPTSSPQSVPLLPVIEENTNHSRSSSMRNHDSETHIDQQQEPPIQHDDNIPISPSAASFQLQFPQDTEHEQSSSKKATPPPSTHLPVSNHNHYYSSPRRMLAHSKDKKGVVVPSFKPAELYRNASVKVVPVDFDTPDDSIVWQQQQHTEKGHPQHPYQYARDDSMEEGHDISKIKGSINDDTLNSTDTNITQIMTPRQSQSQSLSHSQYQPAAPATNTITSSPRRLIAAKKRISFGLSAAFPMTPKSTATPPPSSTQRAHPDLSNIIAMNAIPVSRLSKAMKQYSVTVTTEKMQYSLDTARDRMLGSTDNYYSTTAASASSAGDQESYEGENNHLKETTSTRLLIPHDLCTSFDETDVLEFTGQNMLTAGGGGSVTGVTGTGGVSGLSMASLSPRKNVNLNLNVGQMRSKKLLAHWAMFHKTHFRYLSRFIYLFTVFVDLY